MLTFDTEHVHCLSLSLSFQNINKLQLHAKRKHFTEIALLWHLDCEQDRPTTSVVT